MQEHELIDLVKKIQRRHCEWQTLELKKAANGVSERLYDTLSSFSNQDAGGIIIFGIDEKDYSVTGVRDAEEIQKGIGEQCLQMENVVRPVFTVAEIDGKIVVSAEIPGVDISERPVFYKGRGRIKGSFIRVGEADERMSEAEVYKYEAFKKGLRDDLRIVNEMDASTFNKELLSEYLKSVRANRPNISMLSDEEILNIMGVLRDSHPTVAGLLAFSAYPQSVFPQFSITAVVVPGVEIGDTENGVRFLDNQRFTGNIKDMLTSALSFAERNMRNAIGIGKDGRRFDKKEYPLIAVREAILNALMHRDYSTFGEGLPVRMEIYSDRLEIISPGGLFGRISLENLGYASIPARNGILVNILDLLGIAENRYSGIRTMNRECMNASLPLPEFQDRRGEFRVIFRNGGISGGSLQEKVRSFCVIPRTREEIVSFTGLSRYYVQKTIIQPLLDSDELHMTIPEKPQSKFQHFVSSNEWVSEKEPPYYVK